MHDDADLDALFGVARARPAVAPADLVARVLADAYDNQPQPAAVVRAGRHAPAAAGWRRWAGAVVQALGGSGAVAGLGTVAATGLFIGYASPDVSDWLANALPSAGLELLSASDLFLTEG